MASMSKLGTYSLPLQCLLLLIAIAATILKLGPVAGWLMIASLSAGVIAVIFGIVASLMFQNPRWLALSAAAIFIGFFSVLIGISLGGYPGV